MKLGVFNLMQKRDPAKPPGEVFSEMMEQVRLAEDLGFDVAWFGEHHFSDYSLCPSPLLAAAWCAGRTRRILLAPGVLALPLYDPVRLVQEVAMLDLISEGRLVLGIGTGYQDFEFQRFNVPLKEGGDRFLEFLDILEMGLLRREVAYDGRFYKVPPTALSLRLNGAFPEVVVAGVLNHPGIRRRVAESGYTPLLSPGWNPFSLIEKQKADYGEIFRAAGRDPASMPMAVMRFVHVCDRREESLAAADNMRYTTRIAVALRFNYEQFHGTHPHDVPAKDEPTLDAMIDNALIGGAEHLAAKIVDEVRRINPSHYLCFFQFGAQSGRTTLRNMERFAADVIPLVTRELGDLARLGPRVVARRPLAAAE